MTTIGDLVADARRTAYGSMSEQINIAAQDAVAGATTLVMTLDVSGMTIGTVLSSGLNVWFVTGNDAGTKEVYVVPGYDNSPQGAVTTGDLVYVKPRATAWHIFTTMCDVIRSLSAPANGLFKVGEWTADTDPQYQTYTVPMAAQDALGILGARVLVPGTTDTWLDIPKKAMLWQPSVGLVRVTRALPAGTSVEFRYKAQFTIPTALTSDAIVDVGLTDSMLDIPPLGVVVSLLRTTESRRGTVQTQGDSRRATEVAAGANITAAREFERDFKSRIGDEYTRLTARDPWKLDI